METNGILLCSHRIYCTAHFNIFTYSWSVLKLYSSHRRRISSVFNITINAHFDSPGSVSHHNQRADLVEMQMRSSFLILINSKNILSSICMRASKRSSNREWERERIEDEMRGNKNGDFFSGEFVKTRQWTTKKKYFILLLLFMADDNFLIRSLGLFFFFLCVAVFVWQTGSKMSLLLLLDLFVTTVL